MKYRALESDLQRRSFVAHVKFGLGVPQIRVVPPPVRACLLKRQAKCPKSCRTL